MLITGRIYSQRLETNLVDRDVPDGFPKRSVSNNHEPLSGSDLRLHATILGERGRPISGWREL